MCFATCSLVYGIWVTTASLRFAAVARQRTRAPFLALDLLHLRQRNATLSANDSGSALITANIPLEVFELIKQALLEDEIRVAEAQAIAALRCTQCRSVLDEEESYSSRWEDGAKCDFLSQQCHAS